ncbi:DUF1028 domain-containing protein [Roseivivax isoporae]|uniref:Major pilin protein fimA n=1 Tax=Roseivivax isoporae LMG 25204 TaxID=1449351 RepID=X7F4L1_9RHOB|nr:DUF1028 domain-containing protein [Roseivivax isoporae]ETX27862.1 hypothetical protein RISW2_11045 [Roseivivax isoporae LMG 25204]
MTFSILAHDAQTGRWGGAAATGNLCVGGWVLRGSAESGMSASQGTAPSTIWGEEVLAGMRAGRDAVAAVDAVTAADPGRAHRQLTALDLAGGTGHFTGASSIAVAGAREAPGVVVAGNMLSGEAVLDACIEGFLAADGPLDARLLAALDAAAAAGGDARGLMSAALLVVARDAPPMSLRIDHDAAPLAALRALHARATAQGYMSMLDVVPTLDAPHRAPAD